ncbi:hypothetical protein B5X24_HaOG208501 [Helicoverpa armigera]|uniref:Uncharacterized protein n=1 Tax=Helicoverpa armigera TaxID=29058 RepID=A0A2W1BFP5_HELAM|nr:hypothetical protein B5X24_HaOG208501 [Helicoverpa armigera]
MPPAFIEYLTITRTPLTASTDRTCRDCMESVAAIYRCLPPAVSPETEIMNALESNMRLKILLLPKGPAGKNCYCSCDGKTPPAIIPLSELPPQPTA